MTRQTGFRKGLFLILVLATTCIVASARSRERRHVGHEEAVPCRGSSGTTRELDVRDFKSSTGSRDNEISVEPGKKASYRLIGGYPRDNEAKRRGDDNDDNDDEDRHWDDDLLGSSAGNGKETKNSSGIRNNNSSSSSSNDDDEKKTLSQQVKEGKYGLIQNEIHDDKPKRPGIISYLGNPEVPKDTIENLGGLDEDEIWLAENHVLVLRGGKFPGHDDEEGKKRTEEDQQHQEKWPPIDDYQAPRREVKIPPRPKVPPPFPVQLKDGEPIRIIGTSGNQESDRDNDKSYQPFHTKGVLSSNAGPIFAITSNGSFLLPDRKDVFSTTNATTKHDERKRTKSEEQPPFYHAIPPGAVFLPPPKNQTENDEEDQSIYYPPPYSFYYPQDNTTAVPPGPLVPGIILPPPPDFFSLLEEKKVTTKKYNKRPASTILPRSRPTYLPPRKLTTKQRETTTESSDVKISSPVLTMRTRNYARTGIVRNATTSSATRDKLVTTPYVQITTSMPLEKPTTGRNVVKLYDDEDPTVVINRVADIGVQDKVRSWGTSEKSLPFLAYYTTTMSTSIEQPIEVTPASIKKVLTTSQPGRLPERASYYFYEESNGDEAITTTTTKVETAPERIYYQTTTESPYYKVENLPHQEPRGKQYYSVKTIPSNDNTDKKYNVKLIDSLIENPRIFQYSDVATGSTKYETTSAGAQSHRVLTDRVPTVYYQSAITARPSVTVQPYYPTTPKPRVYYSHPSEQRSRLDVKQQEPAKSKPIYQYSFEATNYSKKSGTDRRPCYNQRISLNEYHNVKPDYAKSSLSEQLSQRQEVYDDRGSIYPMTTNHPLIEVTSNPKHAYFTHQDEKLLDDATKEYFTIFGKKLNGKGTAVSTTPIYGKTNSVTEKPRFDLNTYVPNNYQDDPVNYGQQRQSHRRPNWYYGRHQQPPPMDLSSDIRVNYQRPLPTINPDSEFVEVFDPTKPQGNQRFSALRDYVPAPPVSLEDDILVNYRDPRPPINPDAEFIDPVSVSAQAVRPEGANAAYFAYRLPGDGGHFYFLTPQAVSHRNEERNGGSYLYPRTAGSRLLRRKRNSDSA